MTDDIRYAVASRIADRLRDHPAIDARPWSGSEMGTVRVYCLEVMPDGLKSYQRGCVEVRQHMDGDVWTEDCTDGWCDGDAAEQVGTVAHALCVAANLRRRRVG